MGKRSEFKRRERDFYATPPEAVKPLLAHLGKSALFEEPCAGDGSLMDTLEQHGYHCTYSCDIEPQRADIFKFDAFKIDRTCANMFVTNTPWPQPGQKGEPTVSLALHLSSIAPTWLLLPSDFAHNKYFIRLADRCAKIVSVGRVSWMGNGRAGVDNAAWYLFDANNKAPTVFHGRAAQ